MCILQVDVAGWEDPLWAEDKQVNEKPLAASAISIKLSVCDNDAQNQYRAGSVREFKGGKQRKREGEGAMGFRGQDR